MGPLNNTCLPNEMTEIEPNISHLQKENKPWKLVTKKTVKPSVQDKMTKKQKKKRNN